MSRLTGKCEGVELDWYDKPMASQVPPDYHQPSLPHFARFYPWRRNAHLFPPNPTEIPDTPKPFKANPLCSNNFGEQFEFSNRVCSSSASLSNFSRYSWRVMKASSTVEEGGIGLRSDIVGG